MRCAVYTRKSSDEGLDNQFTSLDNQREYCSAYIKSQTGEGWSELPNHYDDGGFSGGSLKRPALTRLREDIRGGAVDIVIVYKIDRLSRSLRDFANLVAEFEAHGVTFVSVTQSFNTATAMGRLTLNVLLSFAQFERELTGERLKDWFAGARARGMWVHGRPPFGYIAVDRRLVIDGAATECVRYAFARYLKIGSARILADALNEQGWTNNFGRPWSKRSVIEMLQNPTYIGKLRHNGVTIPGNHEPIITQAAWRKVQQEIAHSARRCAALVRPPVLGLLKNMIVDANGNPMIHIPVHHPNGKIYRYYVPSVQRYGAGTCALNRFRADPLERCVLSLLDRLIGKEHAYREMHIARGHIKQLVTQIQVWPDRMSVTLSTGATINAEHDGQMQITRKPRQPPAWLPDAVAMIDSGMSPHAAAQRLGRPIGSFYRSLHRWHKTKII